MGILIKVGLIVIGTLLNGSWGLEKGCSVEVVLDPYFHAYYTEKYPNRYVHCTIIILNHTTVYPKMFP